MTAFSSHAEYHRGLKVAALVKALDDSGADLAYVRNMGPAEWAVAAHAAGVNHPGAETKAIVLAAFEVRARKTST